MHIHSSRCKFPLFSRSDSAFRSISTILPTLANEGGSTQLYYLLLLPPSFFPSDYSLYFPQVLQGYCNYRGAFRLARIKFTAWLVPTGRNSIQRVGFEKFARLQVRRCPTPSFSLRDSFASTSSFLATSLSSPLSRARSPQTWLFRIAHSGFNYLGSRFTICPSYRNGKRKKGAKSQVSPSLRSLLRESERTDCSLGKVVLCIV